VELRGGLLVYAVQAIAPIDADIAEKGHLWTETNYAGTNITGQGAFSRMVMPT
jgi:hypothetical protein